MNKKKKDILDNLKLSETGFTSPEDYFTDFDNSFQDDKDKKNLGYKIPDNYFDNIDDIIIDKINFSRTGFEAPDNYFKSIEGKVLTKINSAKVIPLKNYKTIEMVGIAVAASLVLFFSLYNFNRNNSNIRLGEVNVNEIENWMDDDLVTFNTYEISEIFTDADLDLASYETDEILDYLEYIDIENLILEN